MKPFYIALLMGAAALAGGLVVRYSDHPVEITLSHSVPPAVVAPPIPPKTHVGPSNSVPVRVPAPITQASPRATEEPEKPEKAAKSSKPEKPSAFSSLVHVSRPEPVSSEPRITARVRIPPEPPAIIPLERTTVDSDSGPQHNAASLPPAGILRDDSTQPAAASSKPALETPPPAAPAPQPPAPASQPSALASQQAPGEPNHATLKAGMLITVRVNQALSSNVNAPGDVFSGTLDRPLVADGFVIAERGAQVRGEVIDSKSAGRESELSLRLREILASDGQRVHVVSDPWRKLSAGNDARNGNIYDVPLTRGGAAVIRPATSITFRLDQPVELTEKR